MSGITEAAERACPSYVAEVLIGIEKPINDDQYPVIEGIIGANAAVDFIREYDGSNRWLSTMKQRFIDYGSLTIKQRRSVIESLRRSLRKEAGFAPSSAGKAASTGAEPYSKGPYKCSSCELVFDDQTERDRHEDLDHKPVSRFTDPELREYDCFICGLHVIGRSALYAHKSTCSGKPAASTPIVPDASSMKLDLSTLPDGRYAVENPSMTEEAPYLYLIKKTTPRGGYLRARYRWSKYRGGRQRIEKGDMLFRQQIGDTRKLVGVQSKAGTYTGELEEAWALVQAEPEAALKLYGKLMKKCGYCGRSLTDPESQDRGIGPDCYEKYHVPFVTSRHGSSPLVTARYL